MGTGEVGKALSPTALSTPFRDNWPLTACVLRVLRRHKAAKHKATSQGFAESLFLRPKGDSTAACWWALDTCCVLGLQPEAPVMLTVLLLPQMRTGGLLGTPLPSELGWTE